MRKDKVADIGDEGKTVDDQDRPLEQESDQATVTGEREPRSRLLFRIVGIIFIALAIVIGVYGAVAYVAWQRSLQAQEDEARAILLEEIEDQLALAHDDMAAGKLLLAQRRLEWILQREPQHSESLQLMAELEDRLALPTATPRPAATEPAVAEEESTEGDELAPEFERLQELVDEQRYSDAITALITFQSEHPNYRRRESDQLLYDAYVNLGQELLSGEQVELGLYYLSQAESLGDLSQEVEDQRFWADLYLLGIAYYGVDWETSAYFFRELCASAPFFQNSCQKLRDSLIALGDISAANLDWCPAETYYSEAASYNGETTITEKLSNARLMCLEATPTPTTPITATQGTSSALPAGPDGATEGGDQGNNDG